MPRPVPRRRRLLAETSHQRSEAEPKEQDSTESSDAESQDGRSSERETSISEEGNDSDGSSNDSSLTYLHAERWLTHVKTQYAHVLAGEEGIQFLAGHLRLAIEAFQQLNPGVELPIGVAIDTATGPSPAFQATKMMLETIMCQAGVITMPSPAAYFPSTPPPDTESNTSKFDISTLPWVANDFTQLYSWTLRQGLVPFPRELIMDEEVWIEYNSALQRAMDTLPTEHWNRIVLNS